MIFMGVIVGGFILTRLNEPILRRVERYTHIHIYTHTFATSRYIYINTYLHMTAT